MSPLPSTGRSSTRAGAAAGRPGPVPGRLAASALACAVLSLAACPRQDPLPDYGALPALELTDQLGRPFRRSDFEGKVGVVDFIFTSCPTICPALSAKMAQLHARITADDVHFVSISVDPGHDTPEVLQEYGARYGADPARWRLLTGDHAAVSRVVVEGFRTAMGDPEPRREGGYDILHSSTFVLVDKAGRIRGYYQNEAAETERLVADVERLRAGGGG